LFIPLHTYDFLYILQALFAPWFPSLHKTLDRIKRGVGLIIAVVISLVTALAGTATAVGGLVTSLQTADMVNSIAANVS
jgi:hypothetical protein